VDKGDLENIGIGIAIGIGIEIKKLDRDSDPEGDAILPDGKSGSRI